MKTDRFTDSIRRKLESIRPEFTEKDWAKMQATLHQATPPQPGSGSAPSGHSLTGSSWFSQPFMMAAAAVSTVLLVAFSVWQRHEINQLRQTVTQLSQQPNRLPEAPGSTITLVVPNKAQTETERQADSGPDRMKPEPMGNPIAGASSENRSRQSMPGNQPTRSGEKINRPDTVYVTRYVTVPAPSAAPNNERTNQRFETPAGTERYAVENPATRSAAKPTRSAMPTSDQSTSSANAPEAAMSDGVNARSATESGLVLRESVYGRDVAGTNTSATGTSNRRNVVSRSTRRGRNQLANEAGRNRALTKAGASAPPANTGTAYPSAESSHLSDNNRKANQSNELVTTSATGSQASELAPAGYAVAVNRPLTVIPKDWPKALVRRARSMHSTQVMLADVPQPVQPLSQPVNPLTVQVRAGIGGEFSSGLSSLGVFSEVLLGKNWTAGLGFSKSEYSVGTFMNDHDFDDQTHHDFRQNYVRGGGPKIDIQNIDIHTTRMQIPISLGYRIPVTRSLAFLPTISTYLTLRNTETVTFYYRDQPYGPVVNVPKPQSDHIDRTVNPFTNFTVGTSLEFHKGHWAAQAGPMLTMPLQETMNWQNTVSAGLRMRAFYQF